MLDDGVGNTVVSVSPEPDAARRLLAGRADDTSLRRAADGGDRGAIETKSLPRRPLRRVLSLPFAPRFLLATELQALTPVLAMFMELSGT